MFHESFVVGCKAVYFTNGVVILDLAGFSETEHDEQNRPKKVVSNRVVMTPASFLETLQAMRSTAEKLVEVGFLKRTAAGEAELAETAGKVKPS